MLVASAPSAARPASRIPPVSRRSEGAEFVIENVTGAGGTIGSARVARAAPDGYTLVSSGSGTHAAVEQLYANPPYRAADFASVGLVNTTPVVIVGRRDFPPNRSP